MLIATVCQRDIFADRTPTGGGFERIAVKIKPGCINTAPSIFSVEEIVNSRMTTVQFLLLANEKPKRAARDKGFLI